MKTKVLTILIALFFISSYCSAQNEPRDIREMKQPEMQTLQPTPLPGMHPLPITTLTKEQHEKLRALDLDMITKLTPLKNHIAEKQAHLVTLLSEPTVDAYQLDIIADEIGKIKTEMLHIQLKHDVDMREVLDNEQKIIFDTLPKPFLKEN